MVLITSCSHSNCWYNLNIIYSFTTKPFTYSNKFCNRFAPAIEVCAENQAVINPNIEKLHTAKQHLLEAKYESEKSVCV